jgi:hypothetical protein
LVYEKRGSGVTLNGSSSNPKCLPYMFVYSAQRNFF